MKKFEYDIRMAWAECWSDVWGVMHDLDIFPSLDNKLFAWIVSQTGFLYMLPFEDINEETK
jgi:hypothetical protein